MIYLIALAFGAARGRIIEPVDGGRSGDGSNDRSSKKRIAISNRAIFNRAIVASCKELSSTARLPVSARVVINSGTAATGGGKRLTRPPAQAAGFSAG
jgi:hypothetical protein